MKNGMLVFMGGQTLPGPKLLDIEITDTFPLLAIKGNGAWIKPTGEQEDISDFDHISVPPDLKLHITGRNSKIYFDATPVWELAKTHFLHYFTFIGVPNEYAEPLVKAGQTRRWEGGSEMIFPFPDDKFNSSTRLFVDFFLHDVALDSGGIINIPFYLAGMRSAADKGGNVLDPYMFESVQRKPRTNISKTLAFSIRFGYVEIGQSNTVYFYTPLSEYNRMTLK